MKFIFEYFNKLIKENTSDNYTEKAIIFDLFS